MSVKITVLAKGKITDFAFVKREGTVRGILARVPIGQDSNGHGQGTFLLNLLITEYEGTPEFELLFAAHVVGQDIRTNQYKKLNSCETAEQVRCYVGWNTTLENTDPIYSTVTGSLCINPLSGMQDENADNLSAYLGSMAFSDIATADPKKCQ